MKSQLSVLLGDAVARLVADGVLPAGTAPEIRLDATKDKAHGDFATNLAMMLAKPAGKPPRAIAEALVAALPANAIVTKIDIAGPGFINFFLAQDSQFAAVRRILDNYEAFARPDVGKGEKVLLEFVSANPTGPMHVGHGRGAAFGSALANLLAATGYAVHREYYINDYGRQTDILAVSLWLRYLETFGAPVRIPSRAYPGAYVSECAQRLADAYGERFRKHYADVVEGLAPDSDEDGDEAKKIKEAHLDALIERSKKMLGGDYRLLQQFGLDEQMRMIRTTLAGLNVEFDRFFSERALVESGAVEKAVERLKNAGHAYEKDGALWLRTTVHGDEKDRVLLRDDGSYTYFASDVAYHLDKLDRGFDTLVDVWGADHHGYIARVRSAIDYLSGKGDRFHVALIQFVTLASGRMGKRSGNFVTLQDLVDEAGADATRFFYLTRSSDQHLEFDIDLARSQSNENPVYYLQYAHARVRSMFRTLEERGWDYDANAGLAALAKLPEPAAADLARRLGQWPEALAHAARNKTPHTLTHWLRELAQEFHSYYNSNKVLVDDDDTRNARLVLNEAVRCVIADGLSLLGVSAPDSM
ncbi:MAG: arginine--tRNA ligase [Gammaproteobacteria bacterium]